MNNTLIIDNQAQNFSINKENGIRISTWTQDPKDKELLELKNLLLNLVSCEEDV